MDVLSKQFLKTHQSALEPKPCPLPIPTQRAYLSLNGVAIHNNMSNHINLHYYGQTLEKRFVNTTTVPEKYHATINWRAMEWAYKYMNIHDRLPVFKLIHSLWRPRMSMAKFDADVDPMCVRYKTHEETRDHIFRCRSNHANTIHNDAIKTFQQTLKRADTSPAITAVMVRLFEVGRKGFSDRTFKDILMTEEIKEFTLKTMDLQIKMGIENFQRGYLSSHWDVLQNLYLKKSDFNDGNITWTRKVVRAIWKYSTTLWNERCKMINRGGNLRSSTERRQEIVQILEEHLKRTKYDTTWEVQQLRENIKRSLGNANIESLRTWVRMIRSVKECKISNKPQDRVHDMRAQPITRFFRRTVTR